MRIKCPHCNGKGFSEINSALNMTCGWCMGQGELDLEIVPTEPQTNEEWFCQLPTEEKAKVLRRKTYGNSEDNEAIEQGWANWLKAKHENNPPDIPSVPSWVQWLEGERTKCEYCDGTNAECNLAGRFECPRTPKTEQEYIQICNTEQLADVLWEQINGAFNSGYACCNLKQDKDYIGRYKRFKEWLKQPHHEKE